MVKRREHLASVYHLARLGAAEPGGGARAATAFLLACSLAHRGERAFAVEVLTRLSLPSWFSLFCGESCLLHARAPIDEQGGHGVHPIMRAAGLAVTEQSKELLQASREGLLQYAISSC